MSDELTEKPELTDFHGNKRELLRIGMERGFLNGSEIRDALPQEMMSDTEREVFLFTCKSLGIELRDY